MKTNDAGSCYEVIANEEDVATFMKSWPASGLNEDSSYVFLFDKSTGDIVDLEAETNGERCTVPDEESGAALLALSEDACKFGAEELQLDDVLAIRFGATNPKPR